MGRGVTEVSSDKVVVAAALSAAHLLEAEGFATLEPISIALPPAAKL